MPTFVFNDETIVNSYGFRTLNAGINCVRFDGNPVMLNSHVNTTVMTLGNWENRVLKGSKMQGDSNFDLELATAKEVAGQVDRKFIKGCSMGLGISFDEDSWQKAPDGVWELTKCELMEVSICAVPSNSNALALFNIATGELIAEDQFKLSLKNLAVTEFKPPNNPTMEKIILTPGALSAMLAAGYQNADSAETISRGVEKLQADLTAANTKTTGLQTKLDEQIKLQAEGLVDAAIVDEKLLAGDREQYIELASANYKLAASLIGKMKGKASLGAQVENSNTGGVNSVDDFEKLGEDKKLAFKTGHPEAYKKLMATA